jgi:hypothetical protein
VAFLLSSNQIQGYALFSLLLVLCKTLPTHHSSIDLPWKLHNLDTDSIVKENRNINNLKISIWMDSLKGARGSVVG